MATSALGEKKKDEPKEANAEAGKKREKGDDKKKKGDDNGTSKMSIPIAKGHDSKGLKIPYFDDEGKLQMSFTIGVANRVDDDHIKMNELQLETFDEAGEREMLIEMPTSILNLTTRVITTSERVTIKRSDFEITGQTMEFNTQTKQGHLGGKVRMLIYNLDNEMAAAGGGAQ